MTSSGRAQEEAPRTEPFAVVALVFGVLGGILAPVFALVARSRIKKSAGLRSGMGMANTALGLTVAWVVAAAVFLAGGALLDNSNAKDFSGPERAVAVQIDRFEELANDRDGAAICDELVSSASLRTFTQAGTSCATVMQKGLEPDGYIAHIDVEDISISGTHATARVSEDGDPETLEFVLEDGDWRLDDIH